MWKKIPGFPERYEVNEHGIVKALGYEREVNNRGRIVVRRIPDRIVKPQIHGAKGSKFGQRVVHIYRGCSRDTAKSDVRVVARMVCLAFHGLPYTLGDRVEARRWGVRFKDGDVLNASAENVEWFDRGRREPAVLDAVGTLARLFA